MPLRGKIWSNALLQDFPVYSAQAGVSSGVEVEANEVVVLGTAATGPDRCGLHSVRWAMLSNLAPWWTCWVISASARACNSEDRARLRAVLVKCEPERRLHIRGHRHTMLDHANIKGQRHVRGAVGGLAGDWRPANFHIGRGRAPGRGWRRSDRRDRRQHAGCLRRHMRIVIVGAGVAGSILMRTLAGLPGMEVHCLERARVIASTSHGSRRRVSTGASFLCRARCFGSSSSMTRAACSSS